MGEYADEAMERDLDIQQWEEYTPQEGEDRCPECGCLAVWCTCNEIDPIVRR